MTDIPIAVREARLITSSPEDVYRDLIAHAQATNPVDWSNADTQLARSLLARREPLIDLGLAYTAGDEEIVRLIYQQSLNPADGELDERFRLGLRVACLSNTKIWSLRGFPEDVIGEQELQRIIERGDDQEWTALLQNPEVDCRLLEDLYLTAGFFKNLDDKQRCRMVLASAKNPRLCDKRDSDSGPDMDHYRVHKAIFMMIETVPTTGLWVRTLGGLFRNLIPSQVARPDSIDKVLERWRGQKEHEPIDGMYTGLTLFEEFRCYVAALYGVGYVNDKRVIHGDANSKDIARRCAFYAHGDLTLADVEKSATRDDFVFGFAAVLNEKLIRQSSTRAALEMYVDQKLLQHRVNQARKTFGDRFELSVTTKKETALLDWLGYAWQLVWNVTLLAAVLYVFSRLESRFEIIVVSVLGLIYITVRTIGIGLSLAYSGLRIENEKHFSVLSRSLGYNGPRSRFKRG
jgi:hypothetical protein